MFYSSKLNLKSNVMRIKFLPLKRATRTVLLILLLNVVGLANAMAQSFTVGNLNYSVNSDGTTVTVTGHVDGTSATGSLVIPESVTYNGTAYPVTVIGDYAFSYCSGFTGDLIIPNSVTTIGSNAFAYCSGFSGDLVIPNSVTTMYNGAFHSCSALSEVHYNATHCVVVNSYYNYGAFQGCSGNLVIGDGVEQIPDYLFYNAGFIGSLTIPNSVTTIGNEAFLSCSGFTGNLTIGNLVTSIGNGAFSYCYNFTGNLDIPNSVNSIGNYAFSGCSGFTGNLTIPNSVTSIGDAAFSGCSGFTGNLIIPNSVTSLGGSAFSYCSGFTGDLVIPSSLTEIMDGVFSGCNGFDGELIIPSTVTSIGQYAFSECSGFSGELVIPNNLTEIEEGAFSYCSGLTGELSFPASITSIGGFAFAGCTGFTGSLVISNSITSLGVNTFQNCTGITEVHYNAAACADLDYYSGAFYGCGGTLVIGENVERIPAWMFYSAAFTGNLVIPSSITSIGNGAFNSCSGFTGELNIPISVTEIGSSSFVGCEGFTGDLIIPNSVMSIGYSAFSYCTGFNGELVLPELITQIEAETFSYCYGFTGNLNVPNSVTYIGALAFVECQGFDGSLNLGNSLETIGEQAFTQCTGFTGDLVIPNTVTSIGYSAFAGCTGFDGTLTLPNSLTSIEHAVFSGCSGFTGDLVIPDSVLSIETAAFSGCSGFNGNLTLGNSLTTIGGGAFANCSGFTGDLVIPNSVISLGGDYYSGGAFSDCTGFNGHLTLGNSLETIGDYAFKGCNGFVGDLVIPTSVSNIGYYAFGMYNSPITSILMYPIVPPYAYASFAMNNINISDPDNSIKIYVPYESLEDYKTAEYWSEYQPIIYPWLQKSVSGYGDSEGGWCFIASPVLSAIAPNELDNMISETEYDLYRFNQSNDTEWENYKDSTNTEEFVIANGNGYLYANTDDIDLMFKGVFNELDEQEIGLAYDADATFAGWNLVGNPFPVSAYANKSYYIMNEDGTAIEPVTVSNTTAILPCTGVMVKAEASDESVTFSKTAPEATSNQGVMQIAVAKNNTRGSVIEDKAIVSFNVGDVLEKFLFGKENAQIYLRQGGKDYAIAYVEKHDEMPLNFKAAKNGTYTITVNHEGMDLDYLHLIDNFMGNEVDLLIEPNYTFEAKTTDYASRFRLVFSANENGTDSDSETFAFFNGNEWVIDNDSKATVQVIDAIGRIVYSKESACTVSTMGMTPGMYVLRLINGENVKTQKITIK